MDKRTLKQWLLINRVAGLGYSSFSKLAGADGCPSQVVMASASVYERAGVRKAARDQLLEYQKAPDTHPLAQQLEQDLLWLEGDQHHLIPISSSAYPPLLKNTPSPPLVLYCVGDPDYLLWPQLAMVGSRNPSASGRELAESFSRSLALSGIIVTSGLALGVDAAAHTGALKANKPTVAVVGTGLDRVYPQKNHALAKQIAAQGVIVSEFPLGTAPRPQNFPRRNRIISGLSLGVLVVEAALKSGSRFCRP
ncbi:MAG: DNA-protecting protein DprA [Pseudomonadales bacterium]|nr:DNA-protecting protein DprA [Pseudomonadales bacterium]